MDIDCRDRRFQKIKEVIIAARHGGYGAETIVASILSSNLPQSYRVAGVALTTCVMLDELEPKMDSVKSISKQLLDKALKR